MDWVVVWAALLYGPLLFLDNVVFLSCAVFGFEAFHLIELGSG